MIAIIDYGMGNLRSVQKAFEKLGFKAKVTDNPDDLNNAEKLVLPGVGAFKDAKDGLEQRGLVEPILKGINDGKPFLGICLGLQLLFTKSMENGEHDGLNLIPGKVIRFEQVGARCNVPLLKIPHMGWNQIFLKKDIPILKGVPSNTYMYFVHSYYVCPEEENDIATETDYGTRFTSMVWRENIFATQFHPEKSQRHGLTILKNFAELPF
ncbi:MAG TPA: imidazole glycerol phosphate synthase subunit HisH [Candidatus Brocadiia bacterium]|nr:imidazole glycerol phosphate synthase subunit HisH [Planctomycetota bacterium]MDO8093043.1 imidazole glycerol phosphate synthase subunit HisH [Candidatus Brocadiales bacterium]